MSYEFELLGVFIFCWIFCSLVIIYPDFVIVYAIFVVTWANFYCCYLTPFFYFLFKGLGFFLGGGGKIIFV